MKKRDFYIVTTFPGSIEGYLQSSILGRARGEGQISVAYVNPRDFAQDRHQKTDDVPYGGGPGMVMKAEPILKAVASIRRGAKTKVILFSPHGKQFTNTYAQALSKNYDTIILIAGRYEGVDARVKKILRAEEVSIGPYVLTGGELPAAIVVDAVSRQIPGVLGAKESLEETRIASREVYTRPELLVWKGKRYTVPAVLRSGDHAKIDRWRKDTHSA